MATFVLGLYPDGDYFKIALLSGRGKRVKIELLEEFRQDVSDLKALQDKLKKRAGKSGIEVATVMPFDLVFSKTITLPLKNKSAIYKALPFQIESTWALGKEGVSIVPLIFPGKKESDVRLHSVSEGAMHKAVENTKRVGFDPDWISTAPHALTRFFDFFAPKRGEVFIFYFGWKTSLLVFSKNGREEGSTSIDLGMKDLIDAIKTDDPEFSAFEARVISEFVKEAEDKNLRETLQMLEKIRAQIARARRYFEMEKGVVFPIEGVFYTGYAEIAGVICTLMDSFEESEQTIHPHLEYDKEQLLGYAIEIGLALDVLEADYKTLQLRRGRFTAKRHLTRAKKKLFGAVFASLLSSAALFGLAELILVQKNQEVRSRFEALATFASDNPVNYPRILKSVASVEDYNYEAKKLLTKLLAQEREGVRQELDPGCLALIDWVVSKKSEHITIDAFSRLLESGSHTGQKCRMALELEFRAPSKEEAETFVQTLTSSHPEGFVILEDVVYEPQKGGYRLACNLEENRKDA